MHCFVNLPVICPINPGTDDSSWSTDTTSPGWIGLLKWLCLCLVSLPLQGLLVALAPQQSLHIGALVPSFPMSVRILVILLGTILRTHASSRAVKLNSHHLVVTLKEYRVPATRQTINLHTIYNSSKLSFFFKLHYQEKQRQDQNQDQNKVIFSQSY